MGDGSLIPQQGGCIHNSKDFPVAQTVKNLPVMQETRVQSLVEEDSLEREMATNSSILLCEISWTEEPGRLQFMVWQGVGHDLVTKPPPTDNYYLE